MATAWAPFRLVSTLGINETNVVSSAKQVGVFVGYNDSQTQTAYVKFFDKSSTPVIGTDTVVFTIAIPPKETVPLGCGSIGVSFSSGVSIAITGGVADDDTTDVGANQVVVSIGTG